MAWVLFYKRLITLGGAEVLLGQHYACPGQYHTLRPVP